VWGAYSVVDGNTSIILQEIKDAGLCKQVVWDWHVQPSTTGYNMSKDFFHLREFEVMLAAHECPCRVAILECAAASATTDTTVRLCPGLACGPAQHSLAWFVTKR
jgi:hypothetical protein